MEKTPLCVLAADRKKHWCSRYTILRLRLDDKWIHYKCIVTSIFKQGKIVLGFDFLQDIDPKINWKKGKLSRKEILEEGLPQKQKIRLAAGITPPHSTTHPHLTNIPEQLWQYEPAFRPLTEAHELPHREGMC
jgi:hypothetical protein